MMDGTYTAVIDRIVDGETAVVLIEDDGDIVDEYTIPVGELPAKADAGTVLEVRIESKDIVAIEVRNEQTEQRKKTNQDRFDRLSKRLSDSDAE